MGCSPLGSILGPPCLGNYQLSRKTAVLRMCASALGLSGLGLRGRSFTA